jgi:hypothetical protein
MKNQTATRWVSLGLAVAWMVSVGATGLRADSGNQRRPAVKISVYNDAGLNRGTLLRAEDDAGRIFRQAGIEVEWKNCGGDEIASQIGKPCGEAEYPTKLVLRISMRPRGLISEAFGVAYLSEDGHGAYCDVFLEPMEELQRIQGANLDAVLGHVAAHEIAHLLLGLHSHSAGGVMKAHWTSQTVQELRRGNLGFNTTQSATMVQRLELAGGNAGDTLVTMASATTPVEFSALPPQCPNSH